MNEIKEYNESMLKVLNILTNLEESTGMLGN